MGCHMRALTEEEYLECWTVWPEFVTLKPWQIKQGKEEIKLSVYAIDSESGNFEILGNKMFLFRKAVDTKGEVEFCELASVEEGRLYLEHVGLYDRERVLDGEFTIPVMDPTNTYFVNWK